ncbi:hypothetical protein [Flagellimonas lutimaris]|jgi:hypothetical protein|uniref:hypothetical protein n=1 Tax=Flagellimonas TaxID=444459 RepID=UPI0039C073B2|tara:strand:+ start:5910 stop:6158 length:249 start_codon:yes stop_codon:yes gene_type:complete
MKPLDLQAKLSICTLVLYVSNAPTIVVNSPDSLPKLFCPLRDGSLKAGSLDFRPRIWRVQGTGILWDLSMLLFGSIWKSSFS